MRATPNKDMNSKQTGNWFEHQVAKLTRKKLGVKAAKDGRSGGNWYRQSDIIMADNLAHIECKYQKQTQPHKWYEQARSGASFAQKPIVVFANEDHPELLAIMSYNDILDLFKEVMDLRTELEDLRTPVPQKTRKPQKPKQKAAVDEEVSDKLEDAKQKKIDRNNFKQCPNKHLVPPGGNKCMVKGCKYSTTYIPKKKKR